MSEPTLQHNHRVEEFPKLSSLSANCTDDFLLASGISPNIAVYDVQTGAVLQRACGVHEHFINISRFCHTSPHIFATASFDNSCKVWDLRRPIRHDQPVKVLNTGGRNVMCVFSPDDKHLLCSGVDTRLVQYEVPSWRRTPETFPLRAPEDRERYRRSTYLADGKHFVTAATEESHMHLLATTGEKLGVIDFRGVVQNWAGGIARPPTSPSQPRASFLSASSASSIGLSSGGLRFGREHALKQRGYVTRGAIQIDDGDRPQGQVVNHEFVQSVRAHPQAVNRIGALLSLTQKDSAYVAIVDLASR